MEPFFEMLWLNCIATAGMQECTLNAFSKWPCQTPSDCIFSPWTFDQMFMITCWFCQKLHPGMSAVPAAAKVMISKVSIPRNNQPLRAHFYQLIAKAPVECIYGCFLFLYIVEQLLWFPVNSKDSQKCKETFPVYSLGWKISRQHIQHRDRESFHALVGLSFSHLHHSNYLFYHCIYPIKIQNCDKLLYIFTTSAQRFVGM